MTPQSPNDAGGRHSSGIECLLMPNLPFGGTVPVARQLVQALSSTFSFGRSALAWHDAWQQHWQICLREDDGSFTELHSHSPDFSAALADWSVAASQLHWLDLSDVTGRALKLGTPSTESATQLSDDWLTSIGRLFGWACDYEQTLRDEKLSALAEFAAGAGHEINNPLGSIIGRAAQLLKGESDPERRRMLETLGAQAYRIRDMIGDAMLFGNPPSINCELLDFSGLVRETILRFEDRTRSLGIHVDAPLSPAIPVQADRVQLQIVVSELLRNAITALETVSAERPRRLRIACDADRGIGRLTIADNGPGLDSEQKRHCFDPFYSGRQAGRGLGFGLSKCWRIIKQHAGQILLESDDSGTRVEIQIPTAPPRDELMQ